MNTLYTKHQLKHLICCTFCIVSFAGVANGQTNPSQGYDYISKSLDLFVFPSNNQSHQQQSNDEYECYKWAIQQSGVDPMNMTPAKPDSVNTGPNGTIVKTSAVSTLAGLAIGSVTGHAGEGAAIGAIAGGFLGFRQRRMQMKEQEEQAQQNAQKQQTDKMTNFKKAFSACMDGKGYTVQ